MSRFHLTLPSNSSMDLSGPQWHNSRRNCPNTIDLDGEWEVGLSVISVPSHVHNVVESLCYYDIYLANTFIRSINHTPGQYRRLRELLADLHRLQREQIPLQSLEPLYVEFSYESNSGKVRMTYLGSAPRRIQVEFSPDLARLLGYDHSLRYMRHRRLSKFTSNLRGRIHSVYAYCDVLEHVPVGDTKAPLLRSVTYIGSLIRCCTSRCRKKSFDTVDINMRTDFGTSVPFLSGKSFVVLELRRVIRPYFSI